MQKYGSVSNVNYIKCITLNIISLLIQLVTSKDEVASDLLLWQPQHCNRSRGRPSKTYIAQLRDDTDLLTIGEIKTAINDRKGWKKYVMDYRASSTWYY